MNPDFWNDQKKATDINKEISEIKDEVETVNSTRKEIKILKEIFELQDESLEKEIEKKLEKIEKKDRPRRNENFFFGQVR